MKAVPLLSCCARVPRHNGIWGASHTGGGKGHRSTFGAPYLILTARRGLTGVCRIHEFNVNQVLDAFLPYHETPNFIKMLAILHLE